MKIIPCHNPFNAEAFLPFGPIEILPDNKSGLRVYYISIVGDGTGKLHLIADLVADLNHFS